jgi:hypothetical protein
MYRFNKEKEKGGRHPNSAFHASIGRARNQPAEPNHLSLFFRNAVSFSFLLIAPKWNKRGKKVKKPARNYYQVNRGRDSCSVAGKIWGPAHPTPWRPCT